MGASSETYLCSYCWLLTIVKQANVSSANMHVLVLIGMTVDLMLGRLIAEACKADSDAFLEARVTLGFTTLGCDHSFCVRSLHVTASG